MKCHWKEKQGWELRKVLVFCSVCNVPMLFFLITQKGLQFSGAWHSPLTLPTMVYYNDILFVLKDKLDKTQVTLTTYVI